MTTISVSTTKKPACPPSLLLTISIDQTQAHAGDQSANAVLPTRLPFSSPHTSQAWCRVPAAGAAPRIALAPHRRVRSHLCPSFGSARGIVREERGGRALASLRLSNGPLRAGTHRPVQYAVLALNYVAAATDHRTPCHDASANQGLPCWGLLRVRDAASLRAQKLSRASAVPSGRPHVPR